MKNLLKSVRQSLADREKKKSATASEFYKLGHFHCPPPPNRAARRLALRQAAEKAKRAAEKAAIACAPPPPVPLAEWLKCQPGSTRRGVSRGNFTLPSYVIG